MKKRKQLAAMGERGERIRSAECKCAMRDRRVCAIFAE